jgi:hypothetical protein
MFAIHNAGSDSTEMLRDWMDSGRPELGFWRWGANIPFTTTACTSAVGGSHRPVQWVSGKKGTGELNIQNRPFNAYVPVIAAIDGMRPRLCESGLLIGPLSTHQIMREYRAAVEW